MKDEFEGQDYTTSEWTREEWEQAWHLNVGNAYGCKTCGSVIMITKGGVGTLEPFCCGDLMKLLEKKTT